jgi:hypothetical protein
MAEADARRPARPFVLVSVRRVSNLIPSVGSVLAVAHAGHANSAARSVCVGHGSAGDRVCCRLHDQLRHSLGRLAFGAPSAAVWPFIRICVTRVGFRTLGAGLGKFNSPITRGSACCARATLRQTNRCQPPNLGLISNGAVVPSGPHGRAIMIRGSIVRDQPARNAVDLLAAPTLDRVAEIDRPMDTGRLLAIAEHWRAPFSPPGLVQVVAVPQSAAAATDVTATLQRTKK